MTDVIDIRKGGSRNANLKKQPSKSDLVEKLKAYERRHSLSQTSSKKTGKPNSFSGVSLPATKINIERFKPKKSGSCSEWEVIFAYYSPSYPYKTLKLRFNAEDFLKAGREAKRIQQMLTKGGGYKENEIVIIGLGMTGAIEAHMNVRSKPIKREV